VVGSLAMRRLSVSRSPSKRPKTVCVLPTTTAQQHCAAARLAGGGSRQRALQPSADGPNRRALVRRRVGAGRAMTLDGEDRTLVENGDPGPVLAVGAEKAVPLRDVDDELDLVPAGGRTAPRASRNEGNQSRQAVCDVRRMRGNTSVERIGDLAA
jgi:hypothetical protein